MGGWGTNEHLGTPWNPWDLEVAPHPRRVEQRHRCGGVRRHGAVGDRHRHRRLGAAAGVMVRPVRAEDHDRPGQHLRHPAAGAARSTRRGRWPARSRMRPCSTASCRGRTRSTTAPWRAGAGGCDDLCGAGCAACASAACRPPSAKAAPPRCSPPTTRRWRIGPARRRDRRLACLPLRRCDGDDRPHIGSEAYQLVGHWSTTGAADRPGGAAAHPARPRVTARDYLAALAERDALKRGFWRRSKASTRF